MALGFSLPELQNQVRHALSNGVLHALLDIFLRDGFLHA